MGVRRRSDVAYNVWQNAIDNALEFDGVEALMNMRVHHNLILQDYDALAITTTENGGPLTIDHNLWWPGGGRIMKLSGTGRQNNGVQFLHNTYFTGHRRGCSSPRLPPGQRDRRKARSGRHGAWSNDRRLASPVQSRRAQMDRARKRVSQSAAPTGLARGARSALGRIGRRVVESMNLRHVVLRLCTGAGLKYIDGSNVRSSVSRLAWR